GWHVPADTEWKQLEMYLGMSDVQANTTGWRGTNEGGKLKESGTSHWASPNTEANNLSGFKALPGGSRFFFGDFAINIGLNGDWWTSTYNSPPKAWSRTMSYVYANVYRSATNENYGLSIRCVRD
ncbi:MAG: hypothetical protein H6Q21_2190, partial [Bacteroidetes bacterium]|nr:hypothetical protein [Bacteroidota bacterium]